MAAFALRTEDTLRCEMVDLNVFGECSAPRDCVKGVAFAGIGGVPVVLERGQAFGRHGHRKRLKFAETDLGYNALNSPRLPRGQNELEKMHAPAIGGESTKLYLLEWAADAAAAVSEEVVDGGANVGDAGS